MTLLLHIYTTFTLTLDTVSNKLCNTTWDQEENGKNDIVATYLYNFHSNTTVDTFSNKLHNTTGDQKENGKNDIVATYLKVQ